MTKLNEIFTGYDDQYQKHNIEIIEKNGNLFLHNQNEFIRGGYGQDREKVESDIIILKHAYAVDTMLGLIFVDYEGVVQRVTAIVGFAQDGTDIRYKLSGDDGSKRLYVDADFINDLAWRGTKEGSEEYNAKMAKYKEEERQFEEHRRLIEEEKTRISNKIKKYTQSVKKTALQSGRIDDLLSVKMNQAGEIISLVDWIDRTLSEGYKPEQKQVSKFSQMTRKGANRLSYESTIDAQNKMVSLYLLANDSNNSEYKLNKTEFDYAVWAYKHE